MRSTVCGGVRSTVCCCGGGTILGGGGGAGERSTLGGSGARAACVPLGTTVTGDSGTAATSTRSWLLAGRPGTAGVLTLTVSTVGLDSADATLGSEDDEEPAAK